MPTPNKPTPEELKAKEEEAIKAAEELEGRQSIPKDEDEDPEEEARAKAEANPEPEEKEEEPNEGEEVKEEPEEEKEEEEAEPSKELYKKKFSASSREAQKIAAKNRVINQALVEAEAIPEPTEEEMQSIYKDDWDVMSDLDKDLAKETIISKKWRARIKEASDQATKIEKWTESVDTFVDDPATLVDNPELEGKTEEFKTFATEEANNSVPFKLLVSAFLHENSKGKVHHKGKMFENGSGGPNEKPQPRSDKLTLEESRKLRETDYGKWKEYLSAGKIQSDL